MGSHVQTNSQPTSISDSPTWQRELIPCSVLRILVRYDFFFSDLPVSCDWTKMSRTCPIVPWRRINRSNKRFSAVAARWRFKDGAALLLVVTFTQNGDNGLCERGKYSISSLSARVSERAPPAERNVVTLDHFVTL